MVTANSVPTVRDAIKGSGSSDRGHQVASSAHEPDLGKVHRGDALIPARRSGRRQPQRQLDSQLAKPVNTDSAERR